MSSGDNRENHLTITATEKNPIERFDELLALYSNPNERYPRVSQKSLVDHLERCLDHLTKDQRTDCLHRFGAALSQRDCQDIDVGSLTKIVSSNEDAIILFHASGLSLSILKQIQPNPTNNDRLIQLSQLSEICPLVSIEPLSTDLSSFFRNFLCNPLPYLGNNDPNCRSSLSVFMDILCNEMMACSILGIGDVVYETIVSNFHVFSESISRIPIQRPRVDYNLRDLQKIVKISQNETDPVKRIAAFIRHVKDLTIYEGNSDGNHPMSLLSQCLQHTATFLNAHPDLIDSFLETVDLSSSPSDTPSRHNRNLNLISALSHEPLLDPTFPLHSLLSPRSFTDPASSFIRMASTNPSLFRRLVEMHAERILDIAISAAVNTVQVVSDSPSEPRCLDFGRATQNWVVLLNAMTNVKMYLTQKSEAYISLEFSLLTLLVLSAASTHDELSTAAVSVFSNQFGLSTPQTEALLFATPTTFPVTDAFAPRDSPTLGESDHEQIASQSICAEAGRCIVLKSRTNISKPFKSLDFAGCLVNAFHSTTTLPHSFPFFSPELCGLSQQPSVWNDSSRPSPLTALTALTDITLNVVYSRSHWQPNMSLTDDERRDINFLHLFPFLGPESQIQILSSFPARNRSSSQLIFEKVECLVEMATENSVNSPFALLKEMRNVAELVFRGNQQTSIFGSSTLQPQSSQFETSIVEKLRTAEGEERWRLLTQLAVVSNAPPDIANELMRVENDAQALFLLSLHTIQSTPRPNLHLDSNLAAFDRLVELAGHFSNLPLVEVIMFHIADTVETCTLPPLNHSLYQIEPKSEVRDLVINTLQTIAPLRREGVEEGCAVGKDEVTSQIVDSCLKVLRFLMKFESFDPTPVIDSLVSLAVTTDLSLLRSILVVLQEIEERTRHTPTPFSITRATAPFRDSCQSSVTHQPLPSIVASILLSDRLDYLQILFRHHESWSPFIFFQHSSRSLTQNLPGLTETQVSEIAKAAAQTICLILEERRATTARTLTSDDPFDVSLAQKVSHTTSQLLFFILHEMIIPRFTVDIPESTLLPLAPFLTRILTIVVPSSPDRVEIRSDEDEDSQLLDNFLSLVLSLINTGTPSTLSTPPLSSLLSVLSIALVRLDSIPSSLDLHNRFCDLFRLSENRSDTQVRQFVHALCSEGMEDRSDVALDSFSLDFLNKGRGANTHRRVE
ncbi:hypothetical protein BLNAU_20697 [Blattamonas nauphoetae]|uniref:Uncharacterized protein n=1 Tax=Blattamonas nauphoetae TaxID=2049346 RepID=A0ABQ9X273_9EUKA|nr:hypothetical protein BLNAU_20697 [Blattamonas nauphoetae]